MNNQTIRGRQQSYGINMTSAGRYGRGIDERYQSRMYAGSDTYDGYAGVWAGLAGFGIGMLAMYFLDRDRGARRRALLSDKVASAGRHVPDAMSETARDISNRARGA